MPRITPFRLARRLRAGSVPDVCLHGASHRQGPARRTCAWSAPAARCWPKRPSPSANVSVKTSPKATCFGAGTGGSGESVALKGNTALGLLASGVEDHPGAAAAARSPTTSTSASRSAGSASSVAKGKLVLVPEGQPQVAHGRRRRGEDQGRATKCCGRWRRPKRRTTSTRRAGAERARRGQGRRAVHGPRLRPTTKKASASPAAGAKVTGASGADRRRRPAPR